MKKLITLIFSVIVLISCTNGYFFGLKASSISEIQKIEKKHKIQVPIVSFIFDPRSEDVINTIHQLTGQHNSNRIYHITVSPDRYSALQVANGSFDKQYKQFFQLIKDTDIKVIFRTMHEMNGGRYPRGSDPDNFRKAWIHVWKLSREVGLTKSNILFNFSVNHRDMPTFETPSQTAKLITCQPSTKTSKNCSTFEDYYPGNQYVDIIGFSFYNRGKAGYNRARHRPEDIINQNGRETLNRLKVYEKHILIDEVATTAVRYTGAYNQATSIQKYLTDYSLKNTRLSKLHTMLINHPEIIGAIYFNVDYTNGLTNRIIGESDRLAISPYKIYRSILTLFKSSQQLDKNSILLGLFGVQPIVYSGQITFVDKQYHKPIQSLIDINQTYTGQDFEEKLTTNGLGLLYPKLSKVQLQEVISQTKKILNSTSK